MRVISDSGKEQSLLARFGGGVQDAGPAWLQQFRVRASQTSQQRGLPDHRQELWRYTHPGLFSRLRFVARASAPTPDVSLPPNKGCCGRLVFVDGRLSVKASQISMLPDGVQLMSLSQAVQAIPETVASLLGTQIAPNAVRANHIEDRPLANLSAALAEDGFVLCVAPGALPPAPVEVFFVHSQPVKDASSPEARSGGPHAHNTRTPHEEPMPVYHVRNLVMLGRGARATVHEYHLSPGENAVFANIASEIVLQDGACLQHGKVQEAAPNALHYAALGVETGSNSRYDWTLASKGARLSRNEAEIRLVGEGAACSINGIYMLSGRNHHDLTARVEHAVPGTRCDELIKACLQDQAKGVFQGQLLVRPGAQKTQGYQTFSTLLLSSQAEVKAKPELEIYADDVKCSHGAVSGALDQHALFYLRSRGLSFAQAQALLIRAFLGEVVDRLPDTHLRAAMEQQIDVWLRDSQCTRSR